jgi:hypothetical protein
MLTGPPEAPFGATEANRPVGWSAKYDGTAECAARRSDKNASNGIALAGGTKPATTGAGTVAPVGAFLNDEEATAL